MGQGRRGLDTVRSANVFVFGQGSKRIVNVFCTEFEAYIRFFFGFCWVFFVLAAAAVEAAEVAVEQE